MLPDRMIFRTSALGSNPSNRPRMPHKRKATGCQVLVAPQRSSNQAREINMLKQILRLAGLCAIFVMAGTFSFTFGQSQKGGLNGTIKDTQGGVVVGATVEATNKATNEKTTAITGDNGGYTFP